MTSPNNTLSRLTNELNEIFENAAILLMLIDESGKVVNINRTGLEMINKPKEDILGQLGGEVFNCINAWHDGNVVCGEGRNCSNCAVRNSVNYTFQTGKNIYKKEGFLDILNNNYTQRLEILISTSVLNTNNEKYILVTIDDITKLKNQERQLIELNKNKDRFISILAHDLKNPFHALLGYTDLLILNIKNKKKTEKYAQSVNQIARSTYNLLNDLLSWSKSTSGKVPYNPERQKLNPLIANNIELIKNHANNKNIKLNIEDIPDIDIMVDTNMFKTILRNLITNAIKFTNVNGTIKICTRNIGEYVEISVQDNGVGMTKEQIENLWDVSTKNSSEGTNGEKGSGLGLLICKELVEKHGGKIWVESEVTKGTNFTFAIPLK